MYAFSLDPLNPDTPIPEYLKPNSVDFIRRQLKLALLYFGYPRTRFTRFNRLGSLEVEPLGEMTMKYNDNDNNHDEESIRGATDERLVVLRVHLKQDDGFELDISKVCHFHLIPSKCKLIQNISIVHCNYCHI